MRLIALFTAALLATAGAIPAPRAAAQSLPDLGGTGDTTLSPQMERRLGESIVRDLRRDPQFIDDPEISEYLGSIGARLADAEGARFDFEFFAVRDPTINAFALPGGFVGVNTGLIAAADTESQLAAVLAHEIAHVTQRHIARMLAQEQQMQIPVIAALAAAIVLGRSHPDLAAGAAAAGQAGAVSMQLSYSREFEREADRVGQQALAAAGFDPHAMAAFFEKLERSQRVADDSSVPGYLRDHPVTTERIADAQNRAAKEPYRQHPDSVEFQLVRAKLRSETGVPAATAAQFRRAVEDGRYASEAAARYGLVNALLRARKAKEAQVEMAKLAALRVSSPMVETLAASVEEANGDIAGTLKTLASGRARWPYSRPLLYSYVAALQQVGRHADSIELLDGAVRLYPNDPRLRALQSKSYAALGKRLLQHQAQAEYYVLEGSLPAAIEQLRIARRAGDGDFYQLSMIDARLDELRRQQAQEAKR